MKPAALEDNDWPGDAIATIIDLADSQEVVTADDLHRELRRPPVANWAGVAFSTARNLGYIEPVGYQTSTTPSRKHGVLRQWRRKVNEGVNP